MKHFTTSFISHRNEKPLFFDFAVLSSPVPLYTNRGYTTLRDTVGYFERFSIYHFSKYSIQTPNHTYYLAIIINLILAVTKVFNGSTSNALSLWSTAICGLGALAWTGALKLKNYRFLYSSSSNNSGINDSWVLRLMLVHFYQKFGYSRGSYDRANDMGLEAVSEILL